jgi:L-threonylcarbamoyladenylate synthase
VITAYGPGAAMAKDGLPKAAGAEGFRSPGQLKSHYAPRTPLSVHPREEMLTLAYRPAEGFLFFDECSRDLWLRAQGLSGGLQCQALSVGGGTVEAAAHLFELLHRMDALALTRLHAEAAPEEGIGPAINDRLLRASAASV